MLAMSRYIEPKYVLRRHNESILRANEVFDRGDESTSRFRLITDKSIALRFADGGAHVTDDLSYTLVRNPFLKIHLTRAFFGVSKICLSPLQAESIS